MKQSKLTAEEALQKTESEDPRYRQRTGHSLSDWHGWMKLQGFRKIGPGACVNDCDHCYIIHKHENGVISTWQFSRLAA